jgi:hypothetical protein
MPKELLDQWRDDIVGDWRSELAGVDLIDLEPSAGRFTLDLAFRADGTAVYDLTIPNPPAMPQEPSPPFAITWELSDDRVLSVWLPIAPMPQYEMHEWSRDRVSYDVLAVTDQSLALSNRRFDREVVIVLRRVNRVEYDRRRAAEYGRALEALRRLGGVS